MVLVYGDHLKVITMKVSGSTIGNKDRELSNIRIVFIRVNFLTF